MPRGDRTGPMGEGPRTGWGYGDCPGDAQPGTAYAGPGMGRGLGWRRGWGRGRGWGPTVARGFRGRVMGLGYGPGPWGVRWRAPAPGPMPGDEVADLKAQAGWLQDQLETIQARMAELADRTDEA